VAVLLALVLVAVILFVTSGRGEHRANKRREREDRDITNRELFEQQLRDLFPVGGVVTPGPITFEGTEGSASIEGTGLAGPSPSQSNADFRILPRSSRPIYLPVTEEGDVEPREEEDPPPS
jgi:hypothetical protein